MYKRQVQKVQDKTDTLDATTSPSTTVRSRILLKLDGLWYSRIILERVATTTGDNTLTVFQRICMTGLAALKTQHCREEDKTQMFRPSQTGHLFGEQNCPVCSQVFRDIKKNLPNAHIIGSRLLDPITGEPIDDNPVIQGLKGSELRMSCYCRMS